MYKILEYKILIHAKISREKTTKVDSFNYMGHDYTMQNLF